ncbi:MAG: hypothetical protein COA78_32825 [Blastopirellula sp.]|nr:MAG: hypothetical protein COA78_32825 [Blastopirellula sp.]
MELSQFNGRKRAEDGIYMRLCDPYSGEPMGDDKDAPGFNVRGIASHTVQGRIAEMQKAAADADDGEDTEAALERLHQNLIDSAMRYIISPVNMTNDGADVKTDDEIRAFLDMTFPVLEVVTDKDGQPAMNTVKNKDGNDVQIPKFDLSNKPFAKQVIDAAEDGARFLGKTSGT